MPSDTTPDFLISPAKASRPGPGLLGALGTALLPAETGLIALTLLVGLVAFCLSAAFDQAVAWNAFLISFAPSVGLVLLGCFLRARKDMPRAAMAAIGSGIYIGFSGVITILIYLRFPFQTPMVDAQLMSFDATYLGYDWAAFTSALAAYPTFGKLIGWIYGTSLLQLFAVVFILSALGRIVDLHRVLVTGVLSLLLAVAIWWTWPSLGPAAHVSLPADVEQALGLVHGQAAGARMLHMATYGNAVISPDIIMGTIAFPSYHTVMVCLAVFFVFGTWAFWPMVLLNLGMLPSILSHGGHHFSDMLGGLAVFGLACLIARWSIPRSDLKKADCQNGQA